MKLPFSIRLGAMTTVLLIVAAAFGLYQVKYKVHTLRLESAKVQEEIDRERESLHVVAAEWAYLTRPDRLKRLSEAHTNLKPLSSTQVVASVEEIPFPDAPVMAAAQDTPATPVTFTPAPTTAPTAALPSDPALEAE